MLTAGERLRRVKSPSRPNTKDLQPIPWNTYSRSRLPSKSKRHNRKRPHDLTPEEEERITSFSLSQAQNKHEGQNSASKSIRNESVEPDLESSVSLSAASRNSALSTGHPSTVTNTPSQDAHRSLATLSDPPDGTRHTDLEEYAGIADIVCYSVPIAVAETESVSESLLQQDGSTSDSSVEAETISSPRTSRLPAYKLHECDLDDERPYLWCVRYETDPANETRHTELEESAGIADSVSYSVPIAVEETETVSESLLQQDGPTSARSVRPESISRPPTPRLTAYELHECDLRDFCSVRLDERPYLWRVRYGDTWISLSDSVWIEEKYCQPENTSCWVTIFGDEIEIDFTEMNCSLGEIQRLLTPSYVHSRDAADATTYVWYWNSGTDVAKVWTRYQFDRPPYQDVLEAKYLYDGEGSCLFEMNGIQYELDFGRMKQTNLKTNRSRDVCRRPVNSNLLKTLADGSSFHYDSSKLPDGEGWVPMNTNIASSPEIVPLNWLQHCWIYNKTDVISEFFTTMDWKKYNIIKLYRIQNLKLWTKYQGCKDMMTSSSSEGVRERHLFHGTPDESTVRAICHQNFDPRLCSCHLFGKGAYFSTKASYSHLYTQPSIENNSRFMFYSRVLVGKSAFGNSDFQRPPPIDPKRPHGDLYDSCVDSLSNPRTFVVFDNAQCYPEFLIDYEELSDGLSPTELKQIRRIRRRQAAARWSTMRDSNSSLASRSPVSPISPAASFASLNAASATDLATGGAAAVSSWFASGPSTTSGGATDDNTWCCVM